MTTEHELVDPESDFDRELEEGRGRCVAFHDLVLSGWHASAYVEEIGFHLFESTGCDLVHVFAFGLQMPAVLCAYHDCCDDDFWGWEWVWKDEGLNREGVDEGNGGDDLAVLSVGNDMH